MHPAYGAPVRLVGAKGRVVTRRCSEVEQLRCRGDQSIRHRQRTRELVQRCEVVAECGFGLTIDGVADDIGGHERIAISVATDPRPHRDRRGRLDRSTTQPCGHCVGQVARQLGNDVEEACFVVAQRLVDLVAHAQLRQPQQRGLPEQQHLYRQVVFDVGGRSRVASSQIEFVEQATDLFEHLQHGLATYLGGVSGDHRGDLQSLDCRAHLVGCDTGPEDTLEHRIEAARARRATG